MRSTTAGPGVTRRLALALLAGLLMSDATAQDKAPDAIVLGPLRIAILGRVAADAADDWRRDLLDARISVNSEHDKLDVRGALLSGRNIFDWSIALPGAVHREDGIELHGQDDQLLLQIRRREAAANDFDVELRVAAGQADSTAATGQASAAKSARAFRFSVRRADINQLWLALRDLSIQYPSALR